MDIYTQNVSRIEFEPYKNGICKLMKSSSAKSAVLLTIDFENAPKITPVNYFEAYFPLDSNSYLRRQFIENDIYLCLYNSSDELVADIILDDSFMGAYTENGNIKILFKHTEMTADYNSIKSYYFAIYDSSGSLLAKEVLSDSAAENLKNYYTNSIVGTDSGYCLSYNEWGSKETKVFVFDSDWNMLGEFKSDSKTTMLFTGNSGIVIRSQKIAADDVPSFSVSRFSLGEPEIIPTPTLGDANGDGKVNISDVTAIQRKLVEYDVPDLNELAADIDGSGLNANDATLIQKYLADFDTEYTIGEKVE